VDQSSIDRIRSATFATVRKGYDTREVERFLSQVADWLESGAGDPSRTEIVKRELERVGEKTARILASAEETAEQLRVDAEAEADETLKGVRAEAERLRREADEYAGNEREAADAYAEQAREAAEAEARRARLEASERADELLGEAERRAASVTEESLRSRRDLEALIGDLLDRRDEVLEDITRLAEELAGLVSVHAAGDGLAYEEDEPDVGEELEAEEVDEELDEEVEELEAGYDEDDEAAEPTTPIRADRE
jgi:DivIVA domain-containing protein